MWRTQTKKTPRIMPLFSSEWDLDITSLRRNRWGSNCVNIQGLALLRLTHAATPLCFKSEQEDVWSVLPQLCQGSFVLTSLRCLWFWDTESDLSLTLTLQSEQHTKSSPTATLQGWFRHYCSCGGNTPSLNIKSRQMGNFMWPTGASMTSSELPLLF